MKAGLGLLFVTFSFVAVAQAKYDLSCSKSELSIRWPSYESNSEYYICSRLFGRQMTVTCNPGEVFTFVLQSCTSPNRYIPAPALKSLPRASPLVNKPNEDGFLTPMEIPNQPPMLGPPSVSVPVSQTQAGPPTIHMPPVIDEAKPTQTEENVVGVVEETPKPLAPLPPTPAPTPPVVEKETSKKPGVASGKKPAAKKKKSTTSKATTSAAGKKTGKKPSSPSGKKTTPKKNAKQNSKGNKTPKKSAKNPKATDKKSPKA